jgi:hypothetical protein
MTLLLENKLSLFVNRKCLGSVILGNCNALDQWIPKYGSQALTSCGTSQKKICNYISLTSALDGTERSVAWPCLVNPGKDPPTSTRGEAGWAHGQSRRYGEEMTLVLLLESNPNSEVVQPVTKSLYRLSYTGSQWATRRS